MKNRHKQPHTILTCAQGAGPVKIDTRIARRTCHLKSATRQLGRREKGPSWLDCMLQAVRSSAP